MQNALLEAVLITGSRGVIGTQLARHLRERDYMVVESDVTIATDSNYMRADVCSYSELARIFDRWSIRHVFHFAGEVGRENGELFPHRCVNVNVGGTLNVIKQCIAHDARLYFASSSEVYGERPGSVKLTEDLVEVDPVQPHNSYGLSKLHAEQFVRHYVENYRLQALAFRFFMCYGPPEMPDPFRSAISNMIAQALNGETLTVHRGTARSWCFVEDIVRGCVLAMDGFRSDVGYQAYNIGRDELMTMDTCARIVCEIADQSEDLISYVDPGPFTTRVKDASFDKAKEHFGFEATVPFHEGIRRTMDWQRSRLPGGVANSGAAVLTAGC